MAYLYKAPQEALHGRVTVMQNPRASKVYLSTFLFSEDAVGLIHAHNLIEEAKKGKDVKLLVDASSFSAKFATPPMSNELLFLLVDAGVDVRVFHPAKLKYATRLNRRMHDKILLNDTGELITGGANIDQAYYGLDKVGKNIIETEVYVKGKASNEALEYFESLFYSNEVEKLHKSELKINLKKLYELSNALDQIEDKLDEIGFIRKGAAFAHERKAIPVDKAKFISHGKKASKNSPLMSNFYKFISESKESLHFDAQYLIPTREFYNSLKTAIQNNPNFNANFFTNGPLQMKLLSGLDPEGAEKYKRSRNYLNLAYDSELVALSELGEPVNVWQHDGHGKVHSKAVVSDKYKVLIWTANIDPRSQDLNLEVGVEIHSREIAESVEAKVQPHMKTATKVIQKGKLHKKVCQSFFDKVFTSLLKRFL